MTTLNEYQAAAAKTAIYPNEYAITYLTLGLVNEAGEVAGKYKKFVRDATDWDAGRGAMADELGDVLWYVALLALELGVNMEEVAAGNLAKLASRAERGKLGGSGDNR